MPRQAQSLRAKKVPTKRHPKKKGGRVGIGNPDARRLARRGGVKRIAGAFTKGGETNRILREFLTRVLSRATAYAEHANRQTLTVQHVMLALEGMKGFQRMKLYLASGAANATSSTVFIAPASKKPSSSTTQHKRPTPAVANPSSVPPLMDMSASDNSSSDSDESSQD